METFFKLKEHNTSVKTEVIAGVTTFFAMAYIIFVNPSYLSLAGMDYTAVLVATCLSAAVGSLLTAFIANVPFAQAPGMGLNAFFTYTIVLANFRYFVFGYHGISASQHDYQFESRLLKECYFCRYRIVYRFHRPAECRNHSVLRSGGKQLHRYGYDNQRSGVAGVDRPADNRYFDRL